MSSHLAVKAAINSRLEKVKLSQVRHTIFDLIRFQFDLDNASFFRARLLSALKTMSFAITSAHEFRKMLFDCHVKYVNGKVISEQVKMIRDIIWPDGIIFDAVPEMTSHEQNALKSKSKSILHQSFPDQLRTVLGNEISEEGLNIFHEMLQNRLVLKSMAYMILDAVLIEMFPELSDVLTLEQNLQ